MISSARYFARLILWPGLALAAAGNLVSATFTYQVSESLPCVRTCTGTIGISGTITVDQLGILSSTDLIDWRLSIGNFSNTPLVLVPSNSTFSLFGDTTVTAATTALRFDLNETGDGFSFFGFLPGRAGQWLYGSNTPTGSPVEYINYPLNGTSETGLQTLTLPSSFIARPFGSTEAPEPASIFMLLGGAAGIGGMAMRRRSLRQLARYPITNQYEHRHEY